MALLELPFFKGAVVLATLPFFGILIYRIFLHPLSKYPGPVLAKITDLWAVWHAWNGNLAQELARLHNKHGEFVRFGPNRISGDTVEALENVYGFKANTRKSQWYYTFAVDPARPSTHTIIDRAQHARKRRVVAQGLSTKSTAALEEHVIESVDLLSKALASSSKKLEYNDGWTDSKDMAEWASYLTTDVMGSMVFSKRFGLLETTENRWLKDAVPIASRNKYACGFMPWIIKSGFDTMIMPKLAGLRIKLKAFSISQLQNRFARKDDESLHDIFHFILKAKDPETGEGFGMHELGSEANLMIAAGGDTTSTAIASTFFFLTKAGNENVLKKLTEEIRSKFSSLEEIRPGAVLTSCTYLRACVDESMRISPPVPSPLMREALAGGVTINGNTFPAGTDLAVPSYAIHRNPKYYREPLRFDPERWLPTKAGEKDQALQLAQSAFCPFSVGPRNCVGRSVGYLEMSTTVARVLFAMDLRREPDSTVGEETDGTYKLIDGFVAEKVGPFVQFRPRQDLKI
ncbi:cytochrome P450 monooxygenase-like protein 53 [Elsinoe australis]|uniref:Cytochrome P450 monooxygenase-like protein 53 n=1 Tax=Elsinoe australis TaxID=40998 RepID=A0A4U7AQ96_9PEZI|nr:cytochrome P450 monooxygenase-like protein 53 [Elsinoe australis]